MSKTFRPYHPLQSFLLPPSPLDWLPEDHLARFILETVGELDLSAIAATYEREMRGYPPHHPSMMVALLLYAYCLGVPSSRKIEKRTHEDIAFRVIAGNTHPDHSCISEFRRIHLSSLSSLFVQVLRLCQKMGLGRAGARPPLPGQRGARRDEGESERIEAQGDELRADALRRAATGGEGG